MEYLEIITHKEGKKRFKPLSKKDKIATLVKTHVALQDRFYNTKQMKDKWAMKILLFQPQEGQKVLQKITTNQEIKN